MSAKDEQVGGDHYVRNGVEPWDVWEALDGKVSVFALTVIKYLMRYPFKNGLEDLKKARHTLDRLIELEEAKLNKQAHASKVEELRRLLLEARGIEASGDPWQERWREHARGRD